MEFKDFKKLMGSFWSARAILAGVELDIFTKIHKGIKDKNELVKKCKASFKGVDLLITYLISLGMVEENENGLGIPKEALILSRLNPENKLGWFEHQMNLFYKWCKLKEVVLNGKPIKGKFDYKSFILAMDQGKEIEPDLIKKLPIKDEFKLLDLGGGPGTYSILFLKNFPKSNIFLFDLPKVIEINKNRLSKDVLNNKRFKMISGNFLKNPIGSDYDYIWISSVIHSFGEKEIEKLIKKCSKALKKEGKIFILDFFLNDSKTGPPFSALFALNMLINTKNGRTYSFKEIEEILKKYGFGNFQRLPFQEDNSILIGTLL